ncbi:MAG TPA: DUF502 domain-containing protein [Candidatus Limnocylindria bacterium]|nr:DUF502 domain-containing protein [Candidatus Limnocylindria bacterium]
MKKNLKNTFLAGLFVIVPLVVSVALLFWFFQKADNLFSPLIDGVVKKISPGIGHIPGTGILTGLVIILVIGFFARNVVGERVLAALDRFINRIPWYRTIYSTIKQLTDAFSPDNTRSFKDVVLVDYPREGSQAIGFLTGTVEREGKILAAVFVPTNHIYFGDVLFIPDEDVTRLNMPVEQAVRILVSGGIAAPERFLPREKTDLTRQSVPPYP